MTLFRRLQVLNGNVSQADWDRLQYYSRKVKIFGAIYPDDPGEVWSTLNAPNASHPQVHSSTYVRIAQLQSSALFPHLRHLHYNLADRSISHIFFSYRHSLIRLNLPISEASKVLLLGHFWLTFLLRCSAGSPLILDECRRIF